MKRKSVLLGLILGGLSSLTALGHVNEVTGSFLELPEKTAPYESNQAQQIRPSQAEKREVASEEERIEQEKIDQVRRELPMMIPSLGERAR